MSERDMPMQGGDFSGVERAADDALEMGIEENDTSWTKRDESYARIQEILTGKETLTAAEQKRLDTINEYFKRRDEAQQELDRRLAELDG